MIDLDTSRASEVFEVFTTGYRNNEEVNMEKDNEATEGKILWTDEEIEQYNDHLDHQDFMDLEDAFGYDRAVELTR